MDRLDRLHRLAHATRRFCFPYAKPTSPARNSFSPTPLTLFNAALLEVFHYCGVNR